MPDIALRGVPDSLHKDLKAAASRNHRSLNGEILARLSESVAPQPIDVEVVLERIRKLKETIGPIDFSEEDLRKMRNEGRP